MGELVMPKLGLTMTQGTVAEWRVTTGDRVAAGEVVFVVETDKIATEIAAPESGEITAILVSQGTEVAVGTPLARWTGRSTGDAGGEPAAAVAPPLERVIATPLARRLARQRGIDLAGVDGSGPGGRIKAADVERSVAVAAVPASPAPAAAAGEVRRVATRLETVAADRLAEAERSVPRFHVGIEVDVGRLLELRRELADAGTLKVTLTHLVMAACVGALEAVPDARATWRDGEVATAAAIDIGIAVDSGRGLVAPVARDLSGRSFTGLAGRVDDVVARARAGTLTPDDLAGGIMSVSNLGMHGAAWVAPIVNPPQSSILGVGRVQELFRPDAEGRPSLRREMTLVLGADHRVIDGVTAARLLAAIRQRLEAPLLLLV